MTTELVNVSCTKCDGWGDIRGHACTKCGGAGSRTIEVAPDVARRIKERQAAKRAAGKDRERT